MEAVGSTGLSRQGEDRRIRDRDRIKPSIAIPMPIPIPMRRGGAVFADGPRGRDQGLTAAAFCAGIVYGCSSATMGLNSSR